MDNPRHMTAMAVSALVVMSVAGAYGPDAVQQMDEALHIDSATQSMTLMRPSSASLAAGIFAGVFQAASWTHDIDIIQARHSLLSQTDETVYQIGHDGYFQLSSLARRSDTPGSIPFGLMQQEDGTYALSTAIPTSATYYASDNDQTTDATYVYARDYWYSNHDNDIDTGTDASSTSMTTNRNTLPRRTSTATNATLRHQTLTAIAHADAQHSNVSNHMPGGPLVYLLYCAAIAAFICGMSIRTHAYGPIQIAQAHRLRARDRGQ